MPDTRTSRYHPCRSPWGQLSEGGPVNEAARVLGGLEGLRRGRRSLIPSVVKLEGGDSPITSDSGVTVLAMRMGAPGWKVAYRHP